MSSVFTLLSLPQELLETILSFVTYEEVSYHRRVCRTFKRVCELRLNRGLRDVDKLHSFIQREVKAKLPRRESERRNHALARHVDILAAIETRLSLLNMTFVKYIDCQLCCFIPGKVLDELFEVLRFVRCSVKPPRAHELLQELRDISSMAMEHFDEQIVPGIKRRIAEDRVATSLLGRRGYGQIERPFIVSARRRLPLSGEGRPLVTEQTGDVTSLLSLRRELVDCKRRLSTQHKEGLEQAKLIAELHRQKVDQDQRLNAFLCKQLEAERRYALVYLTVKSLCDAAGIALATRDEGGSRPDEGATGSCNRGVTERRNARTSTLLKRQHPETDTKHAKVLKRF